MQAHQFQCVNCIQYPKLSIDYRPQRKLIYYNLICKCNLYPKQVALVSTQVNIHLGHVMFTGLEHVDLVGEMYTHSLADIYFHGYIP